MSSFPRVPLRFTFGYLVCPSWGRAGTRNFGHPIREAENRPIKANAPKRPKNNAVVFYPLYRNGKNRLKMLHFLQNDALFCGTASLVLPTNPPNCQ